MCVQRFDDSLSSAIHITYRILLRSSSLQEPRYPLLTVVFLLRLSLELFEVTQCTRHCVSLKLSIDEIISYEFNRHWVLKSVKTLTIHTRCYANAALKLCHPRGDVSAEKRQ